MVCHLAAFSGLLGVPFGNLIGPLVAWLVKRDEFEFVDRQGKAVLNFQISMMLYMLVGVVVVVYRVATRGLEFEEVLASVLVPILAIVALALLGAVLTVIGAVKANRGEEWDYPLAIRFLR